MVTWTGMGGDPAGWDATVQLTEHRRVGGEVTARLG